MLRLLSRGIGGATIAAVAGFGVSEYVAPDAAAVRSFRFWKGAMPVYAHYKYIEYMTQGDDVTASAQYSALHRRYAPVIEALTLELQGFYYKLAQVMSTRDDFVPGEYLAWCKSLQDRSPRIMEFEEVQRVVERDLHAPLESIFEEFSASPIGAASIGQVHRAVLKGNHHDVVVKVQYPGIETKFRNDINTVQTFCENLMPQHAPYFSEIRKQFQTEFDYVGEAHNLEEVRQNLHRAGYEKLVAVPRPVLDLCTKNVLVMSYLPGVKLVDGIRDSYRRLAAAAGKNFEEMEQEQKRAIQEGTVELKDLQQASQDATWTRWIIRCTDWVRNMAIFLANWTVSPIVRRDGKQWSYYSTEAPINLGRIFEILLRVHAHEIFFDGTFNGDPHPGNILLMPDNRLGLIDYGQVKRLSESDRVLYAKLVLAMARDNRKEIVRLMTDEIGYRTKYMNEDIIYRTAVFWNDRDTDDVTMGMDIHHFVEYLNNTDPPVTVNDEFIMCGRVSVLLRGVANAFGLRVRVTDYWKEEAAAYLRSRGISY